jgi:hypothetical protein
MLMRGITTTRRDLFAPAPRVSPARQAPELNVIHFIVVTVAMSRICILMHDGAPSDA